ncbi:MAG: YicC/YloC family endoribonuclease [Nitrospiraceae bacterium]
MAETIKSMTGYGRREAAWAGGTVAAELRSVNHRFCEIVIRVPRSLSPLEEDLKRIIQQRCARGRIELTISFMGGKEAGKGLTLDRALARQYHSLLCDLQRDLRLSGTVDVTLLAGFREMFSTTDRPVDEKRLKQIVKRLASGALSALNTMRRREGAVLAQDTRQRLQMVRDQIGCIEKRIPLAVQEHFDRMKARVEKLMGSGDPDRGRLHQELAVFADRCDVSEEVTRLGSHLTQFDAALKNREPVGRTLDFLLQEMGREINTIGAKANDAEIAGHVVRVKGELERVREQVQNIE